MFCLGPKHPKQDFSSHGSHVGFVWEPGIWQVHADAGQAVGRGPGATAAGVAPTLKCTLEAGHLQQILGSVDV